MKSANDSTDYKGLQRAVDKQLSNEHRYACFEERLDSGILPSEVLKSLHHGKRKIKRIYRRTLSTMNVPFRASAIFSYISLNSSDKEE